MTKGTLTPALTGPRIRLEALDMLLAGGGAAALELLNALLNHCPEARITVVWPEVDEEILQISKHYMNLHVREAQLSGSDWQGKTLALIATGDAATDAEIWQEAKSRSLLCYVQGQPALSDLWVEMPAAPGPHLQNAPAQQPSSWINHFLRYGSLPGFREVSGRTALLFALGAVLLMVAGHLIISQIPFKEIGRYLIASTGREMLWYIAGGFIAQMIDGALGMAYGVTATTFLLSLGVPPAAASMSVHASEVFTSGVSGWMHIRFGNVNSKLFKTILPPGIVGAAAGAWALTLFEPYSDKIRPVVAAYTLLLGVLILRKVIIGQKVRRRKFKAIRPLAAAGGFLDAAGGGGWGPIVSTTLIFNGRNPRYTIGSVNLAEFFVSLASSFTFFALLGLSYWQVISGLILGGILAAPIAARISRYLPLRAMMCMVGIVVILVSLRIIFVSFF